MVCLVIGCYSQQAPNSSYCEHHQAKSNSVPTPSVLNGYKVPVTMSEKYPKYYKPIPKGMTELDIYAVCQMFPVPDDSGAINHARKKLLIPGTRTGGKSLYDDVKEARDALNRWLELNKPIEAKHTASIDVNGYVGGFGVPIDNKGATPV